jgi:hypothetical protein
MAQLEALTTAHLGHVGEAPGESEHELHSIIDKLRADCARQPNHWAVIYEALQEWQTSSATPVPVVSRDMMSEILAAFCDATSPQDVLEPVRRAAQQGPQRARQALWCLLQICRLAQEYPRLAVATHLNPCRA